MAEKANKAEEAKLRTETRGKVGAKDTGKVGGAVGVKGAEKKRKIAGLAIMLVVVLAGGVLFMGAVGGWFGGSEVELSAEYYCQGADEGCDGELMELSVEEYEKLVAEKKSFAIVIDQGGCTTAERLKEFARDLAKEKGMRFYRMAFSDMKETNLHEKIKYYPSFVVIAKGRLWTYLRADSDDDAGMYNRYNEFKEWVERFL